MKATTCRLCGQEIFMIKMVNRKTIPVDTEPVWVHPDSSGVTYVDAEGQIYFGKKVGDADDEEKIILELYESHFATCPAGGRRRRR